VVVLLLTVVGDPHNSGGSTNTPGWIARCVAPVAIFGPNAWLRSTLAAAPDPLDR